MDTNRNTILAIGLSIIIIIAWQFFYVAPKIEAQRQAAEIQRQQEAQTQAQQAPGQATLPAQPGALAPAPGAEPSVAGALPREAVLAGTARVPIETGRLAGSLNLTGARLDDLRLKGYRETIAPDSPLITLLSPAQMTDGYFADFGYVASTSSWAVPGRNTVWTAPEGARLTPSTPVTLTWTNPSGLTFRRTVGIDEDYLFTFTDEIENAGAADVAIAPYGQVMRFEKPSTPSNYLLHEGLIGVTGTEGLQEIDYSELEESREILPSRSSDGWLGITDKYWAVAMVPDNGEEFQPRFAFYNEGRTSYQADFIGDPVTVAAGGKASIRHLLFAGAKEVDVVDGYMTQYDIRLFDRIIDWGWFRWLTKPMFWLLDTLFKLVGNFGVAILLGTVIIKALLFPLANMSYKSMAQMKKVQPEMMALRERFADDKVKQQQEMMALYKRERINPAAGCWPILVQIPIFFALYKVLFITIEMRHAPFFGWIQDLAAPDPTSIFNLFGLLPFEVPAILLIGVWPLIMGVTMFVQMQMNPTPPDPTQAMIFKWMPIVFTFMLASFPAGLVIYWAWNNTLSILQQGVIMRRHGAKIELWDNLTAMFRRKPKPAE